MSQHDPFIAGLNEPQRQAVTHRDGPLLVLAGPGSGKTRVITSRAAYLVHTGVPARNILAITFTNKAAEEMRKRIEAFGVSHGMWIYTFHALGVRLLREFGSLADVEPGFSIYDESDSMRVVKDAFDICKISTSLLRPEVARTKISNAKNALQTVEQYTDTAEWSDQQMIARVYEAYEQLMRQRNALDFDDLLMRVAIVLQQHEDITERLNIRFRYLLIDEYQDTNRAQYIIARCLSRHHRNICATGDPDQSIYAWRGADIRNILEFENDYPDAVVVRLEQNYRSTGNILKTASHLIRANQTRKHKDLWTTRDAGDPVHVWSFDEGLAESHRIANTIAEMHAAGRPYNECAILYRVNAVSRGLEEALRDRGIPYQIVRGVEFYARKEIRDILAYLRVLVNPADEVALLRIINTPTRKIGKTSIERLQTYANETRQTLMAALRQAGDVPKLGAATKHVAAFVTLLDEMRAVMDGSVSEAVSTVMRLSGLERMYRTEQEAGGEDRLANLQELVTAAMRYEDESEESSLDDFLIRTSLTSDQDAIDAEAGAVMLMTLHAAKGLEFPAVFLVGLEQGLLPHERSLQEESRDLEEERRLCFVGITRAQEALYLTHTAERMIRGRPMPRSTSQFIYEIGETGVRHHNFRRYGRGVIGRDPNDGFVPMVDDLPPEEAERLVARRKLRNQWQRGDNESAGFPPDEPADTSIDDSDDYAQAPPSPGATDNGTPFASWPPGALIKHDRYGVGQLLWVKPSGDKTRAGVKFAGIGEKTLVLEYAPVQRLGS